MATQATQPTMSEEQKKHHYKVLKAAMETHIAKLERASNNEPDEEVKALRVKALETARATLATITTRSLDL